MDTSAEVSPKSPPVAPKIFNSFFTEERKRKIDDIVSDLDYVPNVPLLGLKLAEFKGDDLKCEEAVDIIKNMLNLLKGRYWEGKVTLMSVMAATLQSSGPAMSKHMSAELKDQVVNFLKEQSIETNTAYEKAVISCLTKIAVNWKDEALALWITENAKQKIRNILKTDKKIEPPQQLLNCERERIICEVVETHLTAIVQCFAAYSADVTIGPIFDTFATLITDPSIPWRGRATIFEPLEETLKFWNPESPISINLLSESILVFSKELKELKQHNASHYIGSTVRWFGLRPAAFKENSHLAALVEENEMERFQKKLFDVKIRDVTEYEALAKADQPSCSKQQTKQEPAKSIRLPEQTQSTIFDAFPVKEKFEVLQKHISTTNSCYGTALRKILLDGDCEDEEFQEFVAMIRDDNLKKDEFKKLVESYVKHINSN